MPKLVDYVARYALLQATVFQVVLTEGVHALSRRSVARLLGVSPSTVHRLVSREADLVMMAAEEVDSRRRGALAWVSRDEKTGDAVLRTIMDFVPGTRRRADDELVWLRLTLSTAPSEDLTRRLAEHRSALMGVLATVAERLDVAASQRDATIEDLQLVIDGLTWAVCTGRLDPDQTTAVIARALDRLAPGLVRSLPPGPP